MNKNLSARNVACTSFPGLFLMSLCHEALVQSEVLNELEPVRKNVACTSFSGLFLMSLCHEALVQSQALNEQEPVCKKCGVHLVSGPFSDFFVSRGIGAV